MSAFLVITYDISDPERFADYSPGRAVEIEETIKKHAGKLIAAGPAETTVGTASQTCVVIRFPNPAAAKAWQGDEEYEPLKAIRYEATTNVTELIVAGR